MKYVPIEEVLGTEKLRRFITVARHYRLLIEDRQLVAPEVFLPQILQVLLELYAAALALDLINLQRDEEHEITQIDLGEMLCAVAERLGSNRYYWSVLDPASMEEAEAGCGDLVDDFGDIYKDLNHSLIIFDSETAGSQESAVWQFRFDFSSHWSTHCVNAIGALHYFIQKMEAA